MNDSSSFPAPVYRETVLAQIFEDAKRLFLPAMLEIDCAHVVMLAEQGIIAQAAAAACLRGLGALDSERVLAQPFDGSVEDLFFLVERELTALCGADNAGRIHTARSRNDLDMTMYRMVLRELLLQALASLLKLRERLLELAAVHRAALMPAYTHNQPAQPTTLGHYLMAMVEILERDADRVSEAYRRVNRCPLGACAITTTGFPIDRHRTERLLGFEGLQTNSYGAIACVDYLAESCSALAVAMLSIGRFAQDMLLWTTAEFGYLRLSDGYVQISSIMPQKRNPVPLEHVRTLASRALSESQAVLASLHNTPFADMNDSEDSLWPLLELAFRDGLRSVVLLEGVLGEATFNTDRMRARAQGSFLTVTELADTLVRSTGISFHQAHGVVSQAVHNTAGVFDPSELVTLVETELQRLGIASPPRDVLERALQADHFVAVRKIPGGPSAAALDPEIMRARKGAEDDRALLTRKRQALTTASEELHIAVETMLLHA